MATLTKRYSCGHLRVEKNKHLCPECRRQREEERKQARKTGADPALGRIPMHRPRKVVSAERKAAAVARIKTAMDGTHDWKIIAARLGGVTRCLLAEGHAGEHYNDYRRAMETWSG